MKELPSDLVAALPQGAGPVAAEWWQSLSESDQQRIAGLWDERLEVRFFTPQEHETDGLDDWDQVPKVKGGRFVPSDDDGRAEWSAGYFEHLLQHPELILAYDPDQRTFHIGCTAHSAARGCIEAGNVPADFTCPFRATQCPLLPLRGASFVRRSFAAAVQLQDQA